MLLPPTLEYEPLVAWGHTPCNTKVSHSLVTAGLAQMPMHLRACCVICALCDTIVLCVIDVSIYNCLVQHICGNVEGNP